MAIGDYNDTHEPQQKQKIGKDGKVEEKPDLIDSKHSKMRNKNQKGVKKAGKRPVQPGPSQAPDKSEEYPKRKIRK